MTIHPSALNAQALQELQTIRTCADCIINDMSAACKQNDDACKLFHRRLAGVVNGVAELAQVHPKAEVK